MKRKKFEKKLELKRITIANLNNRDMHVARGGILGSGTDPCSTGDPCYYVL